MFRGGDDRGVSRGEGGVEYEARCGGVTSERDGDVGEGESELGVLGGELVG